MTLKTTDAPIVAAASIRLAATSLSGRLPDPSAAHPDPNAALLPPMATVARRATPAASLSHMKSIRTPATSLANLPVPCRRAIWAMTIVASPASVARASLARTTPAKLDAMTLTCPLNEISIALPLGRNRPPHAAVACSAVCSAAHRVAAVTMQTAPVRAWRDLRPVSTATATVSLPIDATRARSSSPVSRRKRCFSPCKSAAVPPTVQPEATTSRILVGTGTTVICASHRRVRAVPLSLLVWSEAPVP